MTTKGCGRYRNLAVRNYQQGGGFITLVALRHYFR